MRKRAAGIILAGVCVCILTVAACGSSSKSTPEAAKGDGGVGGTKRVVQVDQVRAAIRPVIDAECQRLFHCCTDNELAFALGSVANADDCTTRLLTAGMANDALYNVPIDGKISSALRALVQLEYGLDYSRIHIDASAVSGCAAQISGADCAKLPPVDHCTPTPPPADDACDPAKIFVGSQVEGGDCSPGSQECAPGLTCPYLQSEQSICVKFGAAGDTCLSDQGCQAGLVCDYTTGTCKKGAAYGAACSFSDPSHAVQGTEKERCDRNLICDTIALTCADPNCAGGGYCSADATCPATEHCVASRCGRLAKPGEQCSSDKECELGSCRYDQATSRQLCVAPAALGAACQSDGDCTSKYCDFTGPSCGTPAALGSPCVQSGSPFQCASGRCSFDDVAQTYSCGAPAQAGDSCSTDSECNVSKKLFCVSQTCNSAPLPDGSPCQDPTVCAGGACVSAKCATKGKDGAPCGAVNAAPCDDGFYCDESGDASVGRCRAKKAQGAPCTIDAQCWMSCGIAFGVSRCTGIGPQSAFCSGR